MNAAADDPMLDAIVAIMDAAFDPFWREAWTRTQVANALAAGRTNALLIDPGGAITRADPASGFSLTRGAAGEEELLLLGIVPAQRGRGLGRRLLIETLAASRGRGSERVFLEMREGNPAEGLYRTCGFEPIGRRRDYYRTLSGTSIDAVTFACDLNAG